MGIVDKHLTERGRERRHRNLWPNVFMNAFGPVDSYSISEMILHQLVDLVHRIPHDGKSLYAEI